MKHSSCAAAILSVLMVSMGGAQDRAAGDLGKAQSGKASTGRIAASASESAASNSLRQVLAKEYTLPPGTTTFFEWLSDLSGSGRVGISVTTMSDPRSSLTNIRIGVAFAAPGDLYVVSDVILGNSFYYFDHGGATVPVYGPRMMLAVSNDGVTPVRITQLAAYAVVH